MSNVVIHRTPGLIPLEAFTTFGINAKPNTKSPIGYFGTGLKYAIAILLRLKCEVTIYRGTEEYVFFLKDSDFRGKNFAFVRMKRRGTLLGRWQYSKLPFTTELGKNWEAWQAFRELHSNTLDEGGETFLKASVARGASGHAHGHGPDETLIVVRGDVYTDCYLDRDRTFLPAGLRERSEDTDVQVFAKPSKSIYFRGMRVMDLKEEAQFTYNILRKLELTEDRTVKYPFEVEGFISRYMQESTDPSFLKRAVTSPSPSSWEARLNHSYSAYTSSYSSTPQSEVFKAAASTSSNPTAKKLYDDSQPIVPTTTTLHLVIPTPSLTDQEKGSLIEMVQNIFPEAILRHSSGETWLSPEQKQTTDDILF